MEFRSGFPVGQTRVANGSQKTMTLRLVGLCLCPRIVPPRLVGEGEHGASICNGVELASNFARAGWLSKLASQTTPHKAMTIRLVGLTRCQRFGSPRLVGEDGHVACLRYAVYLESKSVRAYWLDDIASQTTPLYDSGTLWGTS